MAPGSPPAKAEGWDHPDDLFENPLVQGKQGNGRAEHNGSSEQPSLDAVGGADGPASPTSSSESAYEVEARQEQPSPGKSLGLFSREGKFRQACHEIRVSPGLEYCVVSVATLNSLVLAVDSPAFPPVRYATQVFWAEVLITAFFTVEVFIRVVDRGFIKGPEAYIRLPINQIDFVVVGASIVALFVEKTSALNALRSLRMFRLFPTIRKLGTVNDIVESVSESLFLFRDIVGLLLFAIFAFSVVGMNFFGGMLSHRCEMEEEVRGDSSSSEDSECSDNSVGCSLPSSSECPSMLNCESIPGATGRCVQSDVPFAISDKEFFGNHGFDHIGQGLVTVFVQMTCDGGMQDMAQILVHGVSAASTESRVLAWPFFFVLVIVCSWVVLSLFTAVLSAEFAAVSARTKLRKKQVSWASFHTPVLVRTLQLGRLQTGFSFRVHFRARIRSRRATPFAFLTIYYVCRPQEAEEREIVGSHAPVFDVEFDTSDAVRFESQLSAQSPVRVKARRIAESSYFDVFIAVCIVLSVATLFNYTKRSPSVEKLFHQLDNIFICIFFLEFVIKVTAYSWRVYWADGANRFDFIILIVTLGGFVLAMTGDMLGSVETQSFLSLRLPRLLRLVRMMRFVFIIPSIRAIFETVFSSWQKIVSLCSFVVFMQCMFAVFGMQMLGGSLPQGTAVTECWGGPQWGGVPGATCGSGLEYTRRHFETFPVAFLSSFQYMTGEAWSQIMFWYANHSAFGLPGAAFFFMTLFLWQNCVSISLFVAIILDNFKLSEEEKTARQIELYEQEEKRARGFSDPYVEVRLLQEHAWTEKQQQLQKTAVVKNTLDPSWDDQNRFKYTMHGKSGTLVLTVMDWDLTSADDFLGEVRIEVVRLAGNFASPTGTARSNDVFENEIGEEYLSLKIDSTYLDLAGEEQHKVEEFTVAAGEEIDVAQQLQAGPDWEVEEPIKGQLFFSIELEADDTAIMSQEGRVKSNDTVFHITVTGASNLLADDANKEVDEGGIIAQAFASEFEKLRPDAHKHQHAHHAVSGLQANSLYIFAINNPFRKMCSAIVELWVFNAFILCCIAASCLLLAWEGPPGRLENSTWKDTINTVNFVFCVIFALEAFMKIVATGFYLRSHPTKTPYLKDGLNQLDFFVVVTISFSYVMLFLEMDPGSANSLGRTLRVLRVLAPIRIAMRSERMRVIIRAFVLAVLPTSAVFGVVMMFLLMFATVGTELFKDSLRRCCECSDFLSVVRTMSNGTTISTEAQCLVDGFCWENPAYNFDTTMDSLQTLFKTMTTHGWVDIMESVADSNGESLQPSKDAYLGSKAFFIVFHVIVTFFMLNLLVGVMASSFSESNKTNLFTAKQKEWVREKAILAAFTPRENQDWPESVSFYNLRTRCKEIADDETFENVVVLAILLNVCVLAMDHYPMSDSNKSLYKATNTGFLMFFTIEIVIKMIGYGAKRYFRDGFAFMDLTVVISCWLSLLVGVRSGMEVLRVLRVFRVFLVLNHFEGLMALFSTVMRSIPAAVDVCLISMLLFFIYAIVGMTLFGDVETLECDVLCPGRLNRADNFSDFFHSMQLLFQTSAGQCIYNLMHDLDHAGSGKLLIFIYFASFKFLADFVFVNLIVGIILDTFDNTFSTEDAIFHADDLWAFREKWKEQALAYSEELGLDEKLLVKIRKNPGFVPLPMERIRPLIQELVADNILRVGGDVRQWRCYLMLQLQLFATATKKKALVPLKSHSAQPVSANGSNDQGAPALQDSPELRDSSTRKNLLGLQTWVDVFPAGLDFQKSLMRVVQFELGPDAVMYAERMEEQALQLQTVRLCIPVPLSIGFASCVCVND